MVLLISHWGRMLSRYINSHSLRKSLWNNYGRWWLISSPITPPNISPTPLHQRERPKWGSVIHQRLQDRTSLSKNLLQHLDNLGRPLWRQLMTSSCETTWAAIHQCQVRFTTLVLDIHGYSDSNSLPFAKILPAHAVRVRGQYCCIVHMTGRSDSFVLILLSGVMTDLIQRTVCCRWVSHDRTRARNLDPAQQRLYGLHLKPSSTRLHFRSSNRPPLDIHANPNSWSNIYTQINNTKHHQSNSPTCQKAHPFQKDTCRLNQPATG